MRPGPKPQKAAAALKPLLGPGTPRPPKHLSTAERAEWKRMIKLLSRRGMITDVDGDALALYCQAYARWAEAKTELANRGMIVNSPKGYPMQSPYLSIANKAWEQMRKLLNDFGLTPASRTRVVVAREAGADEYERYLAGGDEPAPG